MNDENLAILIENIIRAVRSCAEPFFVPVTNETEYTEHAKRTPQASRPAPRTNDDTSPYTYGYVDTPSEKCKSIIMSKRALTTILAEAYANGHNETVLSLVILKVTAIGTSLKPRDPAMVHIILPHGMK